MNLTFIVYIASVFSFAAFFPILVLIVCSAVGLISIGIDLKLRYIIKIFLGLSSQSDKGVIRQTRSFDCGAKALNNVFKSYDILKDTIVLPEPSSMKDIYDEAINNGCQAFGYDNATLPHVKSTIEKEGSVMTLIKIFYPFEGWWVKPTRWIFIFFIGNSPAYHWVILEKVSDTHVQIIDPYYGRIKMKKTSFSQCWTKRIITIF